MEIKRGQIWYANLPLSGHIQGGSRPVIIVSNDAANKNAPVVSVVPLTGRILKKSLPTHCTITSSPMPSIALCEQIMTVNIDDLTNSIGQVTPYEMRKISACLLIQLGII